MPVFLGMLAFAPLTTPGMQMVAIGSFVGHLIYGLILGGAFVWLHYGVRRGVPRLAPDSGSGASRAGSSRLH